LLNPGGAPVDGVVVDNIYRPNAASTASYVNLNAVYHASDRLTVRFQGGYSEGRGDSPHTPSFEVDAPTGAAYNMTSVVAAVSFPNINPSSPAGLNNDWAWDSTFNERDTEAYAQFDATYALDNGPWKDLKFGARYVDHTRSTVGWDHGCSIGFD